MNIIFYYMISLNNIIKSCLWLYAIIMNIMIIKLNDVILALLILEKKFYNYK